MNLRKNAILAARKIIDNPEALFLDTETCGKENDSEIVDIAVTDLYGSVVFDSLIKPENPIPVEASRIHGITDEMVANAPTFPEVYDELYRLLSGEVIVVYNMEYDRNIIQNACRRYDLEPIKAFWRCAMLIYSDFDGTLNKWGKMKWHKLDDAAARYNIPPGGHRALADAQTACSVVHNIAKEALDVT